MAFGRKKPASEVVKKFADKQWKAGKHKDAAFYAELAEWKRGEERKEKGK